MVTALSEARSESSSVSATEVVWVRVGWTGTWAVAGGAATRVAMVAC